MPQPLMTSEKGVLVTVGIVSGSNRAALVIPLATTAEVATGNDICQLAVEAVEESTFMTHLLACLSEDSYVAFIQAHGQDNAKIPYRTDFSADTLPGTGAAGVMPTSVGILITFYAEPGDLAENDRLRHSRMIIPGIPSAFMTAGMLSTAGQAAGLLVAQDLVGGFVKTGDAAPVWYRVMGVPASVPKGGMPNTPLIRIQEGHVRIYFGHSTQRIRPF